MKYTLRPRIVSGDQAIVDNAMSVLLNIIESKIWVEEHTEPRQVTRPNGNKVLSANINFHTETDREAVFQSIENISSIFTGCEVGTEIHLISNGHDSGEDCVYEAIYEVVE